MASARQLKHHARVHAAVLRYLFPPSPPHSPQHIHQEAVSEHGEENCSQAHPMDGLEPVKEENSCPALSVEEKDGDHDDERMEVRNALPSRARRKRLKLKKWVEAQSAATSVKRFIGPCLPDVPEKTQQDVSVRTPRQDHGTSEECTFLFNTEGSYDACDSKASGTASDEEQHWDEEGHDGVEPKPFSKAKRRRLAKKRYQDNSQRQPDSLFTAEIMGGDIVIKQMV